MKPKTVFGVATAALVAGLGAGALAGALVMQRAMFTTAADRDAWDTLERVEILSRMRLGQNEAAIDLLENGLGEQVVFLSTAHPPKSRGREDLSYRALLAAKAYFNVFPLSDSEGPAVDDVLRKVPLLQDKERYTDGVRQLLERFQPKPEVPPIGT